MKLKCVANNVCFETITYLLSNPRQIKIVNHIDGYDKETLFEGTLSEYKRNVHLNKQDDYTYYKVNGIDALNDILVISIEYK